MKIETLGQVFTPAGVVEQMLGLIHRRGRTLEPSCGNGAFYTRIAGCVGIEVDGDHAPAGALTMDFFDYPLSERFDTIIGNPPYVRYRDIEASTRMKLDMRKFDQRANLYLFFIEKCVHHLNDGGELIFIVPRDFQKSTSARALNTFLYACGTISDMIDLGDVVDFKGATLNTVIFRYVKGDLSHRLRDGRHFVCRDGQLYFLREAMAGGVSLGEFFDIKVGAVSGADPVFAHPEGNVEMVCSKTIDTGETRRVFYDVPAPQLLPHKEQLMARRIRRFAEHNWWRWGRGYPVDARSRIYVNCKTRRSAPFFLHRSTAFDGTVLALFAKREMDLEQVCDVLNAIDWEEKGFFSGGRFLFSQRALASCLLDEGIVAQLQGATAAVSI